MHHRNDPDRDHTGHRTRSQVRKEARLMGLYNIFIIKLNDGASQRAPKSASNQPVSDRTDGTYNNHAS